MGNKATAETIKQIADLKSLEIYRDEKMDLVDAQEMDIHLTDLSCRIIEALSEEVPGTVELKLDIPADEFEQLAKDAAAEIAREKPNTPTASTGPDAEQRDKSQTPTSGGELDTKEPVKPPPVKKAKAVECSDVAFVDLLKAWKKTEGLSNMAIERLTGVSNVVIGNILKGATKNPAEKTKKKILAAIKKPTTKPKKKPKPIAPVSKPNGKGPGQFIQIKLACWMNKERLTTSSAAGRLGILERHVRDAQNGVMLPENILRIMGNSIPDIHTNMHDLVAQIRAA